MALRTTAAALLLSLRGVLPAAADPEGARTTSEPSWHRFGSNANYRISAVLDVNGGADAGSTFESFAAEMGSDGGSDGGAEGGATGTGRTKTPGYSVPIEVLTLRDGDGTYRQRVSYYGGVQVDYNDDGAGYKVIPTPYTGESSGGGEDPPAARGGGGGDTTCFFVGGSESGDADEKVGYLNFFPTVEQMEHYTLGRLVTNEPGVPYRVATLEAPHGTYDATSHPSRPDASYDSHPGMPSEDWFQFHYEESLASSGGKQREAARPIKWTMLARNQIINAHTEDWVIRYLSYESIDEDDERKLWADWFDAKFRGACGDGQDRHTLADADAGRGGLLQLNRLGMFFSASAHSPATSASASASPPEPREPSRFDLFLARHNRHYPRPEERSKRRAIHDRNVADVARWNEEHAGRTTFAPNEFMDLEVEEVMRFRGGYVPRRGGGRIGRAPESGGEEEATRNLRFAYFDKEPGPRFLFGDGATEASSGDGDGDDGGRDFPIHEVPKDFDPSTLPSEFDWRDHLPGSVGPVKDQGFCGSCWAFSFVSALESHWFIAHGQSIALPEQFVNDCAWSDEAHACDGGQTYVAAANLLDRFGGRVPARDAYGGYLSVDGGCYVDVLPGAGTAGDGAGPSPSSTAATPSAVRLTDWALVPGRDDVAAKHAIFTKGPLAIAVNVVGEALYYSDGVLDVESCEENDERHLDHAITVVGWGTDDLPGGGKAEHWILRNSWSDLWGDAGYFRVRMGERDCGVTTSAGYPVVAMPGANLGSQDPSGNIAIN